MKNARPLVTAAITLLALPILVFAQEQQFSSKPYVGIDLGYSRVKDQSSDIGLALVSTVGGSATVRQDSTAYIGRLFGGYKLTENIDFELGYMTTNNLTANFTGVSSSAVAYSGSVIVKVSGLDYAALLRPSVSSGFNNFYVRLGGTSYTNKISGSVNGIGITDSSSGMGYQYGLGYDSSINQSISYRVSFTRFEKIGGESGAYANVLSAGLQTSF
jgi:hypothetical protein